MPPDRVFIDSALADIEGMVRFLRAQAARPEGAAALHGGVLTAGRAEIELRIGPGDLLARATAHAERAGCLCHEFGDSTLIARSRRAANR